MVLKIKLGAKTIFKTKTFRQVSTKIKKLIFEIEK